MEVSAELKEKYAWLSMAPNQAWFKAKQGDLEAQYVLGMCHLHGVQQDKSSKSAASWLSQAANGGHVCAQFQIALLWLAGTGVTRQDDSEATQWLQKAAAENHPEALYNMGVLCLNGTGMPQSGKEAAKYFHKAAQLGNREAQFRYAMVLEYEVQKMRRKMKEQAEAPPSSPGGESDQDEVEEDDEDEEEDDDYFGTTDAETDKLEPLQPSDVKGKVRELLGHALHWMINAAKQNHGLAQHKSALLYMLGVEPVDPDAKKVVFHTLPSVVSWAKSYVYSLNLGEAKPISTKPSVVTWNNHMKKIEEKVGPNLEKAAEWHEQAANSGVLASQYAIAIAKETGLGTTVNQEESFTWYIVAASGQLGDGEGRMQGVEYICPHCLAWNPNRRLYIYICMYVCM